MVVINLSSYFAPSSPSSLRSPISLLPLKPHFLRLKPQSHTPFPYPSLSSFTSHRTKSRESFKSWAFAGIGPGNFESAQSVLEACLVLTAIIVVHESGHFLAATLQGIHVSKFAVGFGPILAKFNAKNVEYSVRAFPLGGFVGFPDNDPDSEIPPGDENLLKNRPILDRAIVISAGVIANVIFAYVIIFVQILAVGLPVQEAFPGVLIPEVRPFSAASRDGIFPGDVVVAVDGAELPKSGSTAVSSLVEAIKKSPKRTLVFKIERAKKDFDVRVTPDENSSDGTGKIGVQLSPNTKFTKIRPKSVSEAFGFSWREFSGLTWNVVDGLRQTFLNFSQTAGKVSGPVAIIAVGAEVARSNSDGLYQFAALLNINLAVINLLPLPALDGGSLALIAVEAVRGGRKIPMEIEQRITSSGIMVVVLFGLYLIVKDTLSLEFVRDML